MASKTGARKNTKVAQVEQVKKDEVLAKVKDLDPKLSNSKLAAAQADVVRQFVEIQAKLIEQQQELITVQQAIGIKQQELKDLHGLSEVAMDQAKLEDQITMTREQWAREKAERDQAWTDQEKDFQTQAKRAELEWDYEASQAKKKRSQQLEDDLTAKTRLFTTTVEIKEKQMTERDAALKSAEKELADLRALGQTFDARVSKEVATQVAIREASIKKQSDHDRLILEKDKNSAVALAQQQVAAAGKEIESLEEALTRANQVIEQLRGDMKAVSTEALRAVSGQQALDAVQKSQAVASAAASSGKR